LSLYRIIDRPGEIERDNALPLASKTEWGAAEPISKEERTEALQRAAQLIGYIPSITDNSTNAGEFAILLAHHLLAENPP